MFKYLFCCISVAFASVVELKDDQVEEFIKQADKPVIIDFWSNYCPPCARMKPVFEEIAEELKDEYLFATINIAEGQLAADKYKIESIPTFKIVKNGEVLGTLNGYIAKESFKENVANILNEKISQTTLMSAIQANDLELVARCLLSNQVEVNGMSMLDCMGVEFPMTPLMMAVSRVIFANASHDIIHLLLQNGADKSLEVNFPVINESFEIIGHEKQTASTMIEQVARPKSEEELAGIPEEIRPAVIEFQKKASDLLDLLNE